MSSQKENGIISEDELTDMFGEGGKEEIKDYYSPSQKEAWSKKDVEELIDFLVDNFEMDGDNYESAWPVIVRNTFSNALSSYRQRVVEELGKSFGDTMHPKFCARIGTQYKECCRCVFEKYQEKIKRME